MNKRRSKNFTEERRLESPESSNKLANLLSISRILLGKTPFEEKIKKVAAPSMSIAMDDPTNSAAWIEVDDVIYGDHPRNLTVKYANMK